jgi:pSer/pThr/pTyr-binding forkhead associated (FHA) protein
MPVLRIKSGSQKGKIHDIREDSLVLGRETGGGLQLLDQGVSRRHAEIFRIGEMFFIRDLDSRNGTFVNDKPINEEILRVGDQVRLGNTVVVFEDRLAELKDSSRILRDDGGAEDVPQQPTSTIHLRVKEETTALNVGLKPAAQEPGTIESRNLNLLLLVGHIMSEEKDLFRLLGRISEAIGKSLDADHVYVLWKHGDERGEFEILGRFDRSLEEGVVTAGVSRGIIRDCLRFGRSVLTSDASLDKQFDGHASVVLNQLRSVICVPISILEKRLGVLYIYSRRPQAFSAEDLELASAVGIQLGTAIGLLKLLRKSDKFFRTSIKTLVSALEMRSPPNAGKSERVATYCLAVAKELGLGTHDLRSAWLAGMLHNIGSMPMSDRELEQDSSSQSKKNTYARKLLKQVPELEEILPAIESQGERFDGSGMPDGKKGQAIPLLGRILGLALELDQLLTQKGPEGADLSLKETLLKLKEMADRQFDREIVNALLIAYRNGKLFNQEEEFFEVPLE